MSVRIVTHTLVAVLSLGPLSCAPSMGPAELGAGGGKGEDFVEADFVLPDEGSLDLSKYSDKPRDSLGLPFIGTVLGMRGNEVNEEGVNNFPSLTFYARRFATIVDSYGAELKQMGFDTCTTVPEVARADNYGVEGFDPTPGQGQELERPALLGLGALEALGHVLPCLFQRVSKEPFAPITLELFTPDYLTVDFRTNGSFPYGRRPDDQVASKFFALVLDLENGKCGKLTDNPKDCTVDSLQDPSLYQAGAPTDGRTYCSGRSSFPMHPEKNDKVYPPRTGGGFAFPYLAEPHGLETTYGNAPPDDPCGASAAEEY